MSSLRFHILPSFASIGFIVAAWVTLSLPIAAVFLIDRQFIVSDYLKFLLHALGVASAITIVLIFPMARLMERILLGGSRVALAVPLIPVLVAGACVLVRVVVTREFFDTVFGWAGVLLGLAMVLAFYWVVFLIELAVFRRLRRREAPELAVD